MPEKIHSDIEAQGEYSIDRHQHVFAVWAASRASSVKGCRFPVEIGRHILEASGFDAASTITGCLPEPKKIDLWHRCRREAAIKSAKRQNLEFSHGVAAKLINVYLKSRFVCSEFQTDERICALHPPVDRLLLMNLATKNVGGFKECWKKASHKGWSKFDSDYYEQVIRWIRESLCGRPLWMIEEHWPGHQKNRSGA